VTLGGTAFAFFFAAVFVLYWVTPRRAWLQNGVLLLASYLFYATWNLRLLPLLVGVTLLDFASARYLGRQDVAEPRRRAVFFANVAFNLGLLCLFKYFGFFASSMSTFLARFGWAAGPHLVAIALPLGISYFTLSKLGAMIDVYHRRTPPCRSLVEFALFVAFFPQLIAGPIGRAGSLFPQYAAARRPTARTLSAGATAFLLGFTMKAYVAEWLGAACAGPVFAEPAAFSTAGHWAGLLAYALQIFFDFAGYSLMAIGTGRLFGIELPQNFNRPFLATSLMQIWRRWHISLNGWLFDYVFNPLTTGQSWMRGRVALGLFLVLLLSGIWHGARWTFVLWGALHGLGLVVQYRWDVFYRGLCRKDRVWVQRRRSRGYQLASWGLTQGFFVLTLVPFRLGDASELVRFLSGLATSAGSSFPEVRSLNLAFVGAFVIGYHVVAIPALQQSRLALRRLPAPVRGIAYGLAIVFLAIFVPTEAGTFIYAQF
jgi:D-alanyl-lipoteichoic acid acyltransferase DltB (MBOAT superfamily)